MKNKKLVIKLLILIIFAYIFTCFSNIFGVTNSDVKITVPSAIVIDAESGRVLYEKNGYEKRPMASLTKMITAIVAVENCKLDEEIEVSNAAAIIGGSTVGIKKGDKITLKNLLYGLLLSSGNDCAIAIAEHVGGSIEGFADMMNAKAKEIGAKDSSFKCPHGLDMEGHYSTSYDLALIARYALNNKIINDIVKTVNININFGSFTKNISNTNRLLSSYEYADGVKTGFTNGANRCVVGSATKNGFRIISVVLGAETSNQRFNDAQKLLDDTFKRYKVYDLTEYMKWFIKIPVVKGNIKYYESYLTDSLKLPLTEAEFSSIYVKQDMVGELIPPLPKGTKIGELYMQINDEIIYDKEVYLDKEIKKKNIWDYFFGGIAHMFDVKIEI